MPKPRGTMTKGPTNPSSSIGSRNFGRKHFETDSPIFVPSRIALHYRRYNHRSPWRSRMHMRASLHGPTIKYEAIRHGGEDAWRWGELRFNAARIHRRSTRARFCSRSTWTRSTYTPYAIIIPANRFAFMDGSRL